jgi:hypothetical protein
MPDCGTEFADALIGAVGMVLTTVSYRRLWRPDGGQDLDDPDVFIGEEVELVFHPARRLIVTWGQGRGWHGDCSVVVSTVSLGLPNAYSAFDAGGALVWQPHVGHRLQCASVLGWDATPLVVNFSFESGDILVGTGSEELGSFGDGLDMLVCAPTATLLGGATVLWASSDT